ncbi:hypothetical protein PHISCL_01611 [Aspergillus sclerotialis]|uniref:Uncharacterized protein n=1 Tax=Aspergillus sclerotialis TaxID=2070753 RepID=A0A3A2ZSQ6_9EURO|nr:hypothetical protein PHISCL_01611 [Aspergillus sclerotialis]
MDRDHSRRYDDNRGGESYRPTSRSSVRSSLSYARPARSPPRNRSPRLVADTWAPSASRAYVGRRVRSRSPPAVRRRSRSPSFQRPYGRMRTPPRKFSPRQNDRARSPSQSFGRSRSPYSENRSQNASWGTLKQSWETPSPNEDSRYSRREGFASHIHDKYLRHSSPSRRGMIPDTYSRTSFQNGDPAQGGWRDRHVRSTSRRRSPSPSRSAPSAHTSASCSGPNSRRSSPLIHSDRAIITPFGFRSRSPTSESTPHQRIPSTQDPLASDQARNPKIAQNERGHRSAMEGRAALCATPDLDTGTCTLPRYGDQQNSNHLSPAYAAASTPSQPKSYNMSQRHLQPGNSHNSSSLASQRRGPNISLLSAPTGPRGGNLRESPWARRGPTSTTPHGPPLGPRGSSVHAGLGNEFQQQSIHRQNSATPTIEPRVQKFTNHLAGLCSVIPGGKLFPSSLDTTAEKRLAQLEADRERLFEQAAASQRLKRLVIMDWDKLDRESSVSDLKSELAEGHLQCITDGQSVPLGVVSF